MLTAIAARESTTQNNRSAFAEQDVSCSALKRAAGVEQTSRVAYSLDLRKDEHGVETNEDKTALMAAGG